MEKALVVGSAREVLVASIILRPLSNIPEKAEWSERFQSPQKRQL